MTIQLPVVQQPTHSITLPSCGDELTIRPFITKEEKIFLMAVMSDDVKDYLRACKQIIQNCIIEWGQTYKKVSELPLYDLEYIMLQLRIISIGENIKVFLNGVEKTDCDECKKPIEIEVNLKDVNCTPKQKSNIVMIDETNGFTLKPLTVGDQEKLLKLKLIDSLKKSTPNNKLNDEQLNVLVDGIFTTVALSIDSFFDAEKQTKVKEEDLKAVQAWVEDLPKSIFQKIEEYIAEQPSIKHSVKVKCTKCSFEQEVKFEGLEDFFD
jgi:hypothetical protein